MKLSPVIVRLRANAPSFANRVAGAAEFAAAVEQDQLPVPAAYVVPGEDEAEPSQTAGLIVQVQTEVIGVVVAVDNSGDARGQAASEQIDDLRAELLAALLGWEPAVEWAGFEYVGSALLAIDRARLWYQFDFRSVRAIVE